MRLRLRRPGRGGDRRRAEREAVVLELGRAALRRARAARDGTCLPGVAFAGEEQRGRECEGGADREGALGERGPPPGGGEPRRRLAGRAHGHAAGPEKRVPLELPESSEPESVPG